MSIDDAPTEPRRAEPPERACPTCRHVLWAVALGLGVRCQHPANNPDPVGRVQDLFQIPNRHFVCPHYEPSVEDDKPPAS